MEAKFVELTVSDKYQLDRPEVIDKSLIKSDYVQYRPLSLAGLNSNAPFRINIPREDVFIDIRDSYLEIEVQVLKTDDTLYGNDNDIQLINLFPISLFREMSLSSFGSKNLERVDNVYLASLMYKLLSDNEEDMMTVYRKDTSNADIDTVKRDRMLNDTPEKGTIFCRIYLKDVFGFVNHTDKINYGMGYSLILKRSNNGNSIYRTIGDEAKINLKDIVWHVRHDTPSMENTSLVTDHVLSNKNTEYSYVSRSITQKPVNTRNQWIMEIGTESNTDVPIFVIVGFQTQARINDQTQNNSIFDRPNIREASCYVGTVRYPDNEYQIEFARNKYNDAYNEVKRFYKNYIQGEGSPYISFKEFKNLYPLFVFDLRSQKYNPSAQPIQCRFKFEDYDIVALNYLATALVLTQKIISVSSDGQRQFDIV